MDTDSPAMESQAEVGVVTPERELPAASPTTCNGCSVPTIDALLRRCPVAMVVYFVECKELTRYVHSVLVELEALAPPRAEAREGGACRFSSETSSVSMVRSV